MASVSPCSSLGSPSWLEPAWGVPPRAACRQRRLTASSGSIRWIYPLDLSVGSIRWIWSSAAPPAAARGASFRTFYLHWRWSGLGLSPPLSLLPSPPEGGAVPTAPLLSGSGRAGAGPRATAESLIPVRPSVFGLTGVKGGATARGAGSGKPFHSVLSPIAVSFLLAVTALIEQRPG